MCSQGSKDGFVLVVMMASAVVLLSLVGLAVDTGRLHLIKTRMQTAADAAALGAVRSRNADSEADTTAAARSDAANNGFVHNQDRVAVAVTSPPSSGYYIDDPTAVEVNIHQTVRTMFMVLAGFPTMEVNARSVARRAGGPNCVYALDTFNSSAVSASGGAIIQVNCGMMIDSSSDNALSVTGGANVTATSVSIAGDYSTSGGGIVTPAPLTGSQPEPDPFAAIAAPPVGACTENNFGLSAGQDVRISEGVYCGGISISGGARLTLNPGSYVLKGGGLKVSGNSYLTGIGVLFYNTYGAGHAYSGISLSGQAIVQLSAPISGPRAGILFFQDRTYAGNTSSTITGGAQSRFDGALYFPTTSLSYAGGTATDYTILIAKTLSFTGGTVLHSDYSSLPGGTPVKTGAALGE